MSDWSGENTGGGYKARPVFRRTKGGGPFSRALAWIIVLLFILSMCSGCVLVLGV